MNHILRIPAANSIRTVDRQHSITRQDYEKVRNSRDDYGRKNNRISGIDWYRIGTHLAQACLFLSLLRVQLGHNLRYNLYNAEEKRERERAANIVYAVCNDARSLFQKRRGTSIKTLFVVDLIESVNPWRLIGTHRTSDRIKFDSCRWINCRASSIWVREQF